MSIEPDVSRAEGLEVPKTRQRRLQLGDVTEAPYQIGIPPRAGPVPEDPLGLLHGHTLPR